jgi:hypothetical protein
LEPNGTVSRSKRKWQDQHACSDAIFAFWSISGENADLTHFLDQAVVKLRAVEIHHVKVLQYRPRSSDLHLIAGAGWKQGVVGSAVLSADLRSPPGREFQTAEPVTISEFMCARTSSRSIASSLGATCLCLSTGRAVGCAGGGQCGAEGVHGGLYRIPTAAILIGSVLRHDTHPEGERLMTAA